MKFVTNFIKKVKTILSKLGDTVEAAVDKAGLELVDEWRKFTTMYSTWFFAALGSAPDLYNQAVAAGVIDSATAPVLLTRIINVIAFAGFVSRMVKQKKLEAERDRVLGGNSSDPST